MAKKWLNTKERYKYYFWMGKIFRALDTEVCGINVVRIVCKERVMLGFYDTETKRIFIDIRGDIIATLVHEALHAHFDGDNPEKEEEIVQEIEQSIMDKITARHLARLRDYLLTPSALLAPNFPIAHY